MKRIFLLLTFIAAMTLAFLSSCSSKQLAVTRLEKFSYELRDNARYYTINDWKEAVDKFSKIRKDLNKYNYNDSEREHIGELEGKCAGYVVEGVKGKVQNYGSEINGILQGLNQIIGF